MNYALLQCKRFHKFHVWDIILLVNKNNTLLHLRAQGKTGNFAEDLCIPENGLSLGKNNSHATYHSVRKYHYRFSIARKLDQVLK